MFVRDYMTRNVNTINDDARLLDAALMIRRTGKRHVPILSATTGKVVGIISDRDVSRFSPSVLERHTEREYNEVFENTPITKVMTANPLSISPDAPIAEAAQMLYTTKVGAILAVSEGELKGILSVSDMLGLLNELLAPGSRAEGAAGG
jgi:acetoin utilization protein AcuB